MLRRICIGGMGGLILAVAVVASGCGQKKAETTGQAAIPRGAVSRALNAGAGTLSVFAGVPTGAGSADGTGPAARLYNPQGVAVDATGNTYVADTGNQTIRKIAPGGVVSTLAGTAGAVGSADGTGPAARFNYPLGLAVDGAGNVYVADSGNHTIRRVTPGGVVSTLAGTALVAGSADGTGLAARFNYPSGLAVDGSGSVYVADRNNSTIRKITPAGVVSTIAGTAFVAGSADGTGPAAQFNTPFGVAADGSGNVYVADMYNHTIRKITPGGVVSTVAGTALVAGSTDGTGASARFYYPQSVTVDGAGNVFVADMYNFTIRKITAGGVVSTLAGTAFVAGSADGTGPTARFNYPAGVAVDGSGNIQVADRNNHTIRKVTPGGVVTTLTGTALSTGSIDGTGPAARFSYPLGAAVDGSGNVYVADTYNHTIRKITPAGVVSTFAGTALVAGGADGTGSAARFYYPHGVAVDGSGNVYVADTYNFTIRKITAGGVVSTMAGTALSAGSIDGTGPAARFKYPQGLTVDGSGNVYVADSSNLTIRKITPGGVVSTHAGTAGVTGSSDGAGPSARFSNPQGVAADGSGSVYVADMYNNTIRKITPGGVVSTLAGTAPGAGSADGMGPAAGFYYPRGLAVDGSGNVYVADSNNSSVRKITPDGVVSTVVGTLSPWTAGNFPGPLPASLTAPFGVAVDPATGSLYLTVADAVLLAANPLAISTGGGGGLTVPAGEQVTLAASGGNGTYTWTISTNASGGSVTAGGVYTAGSSGGTDVVTVTDSGGNSTTITITVPVVATGWKAAGSMAAAREAHTTTLLPSGKLLVAGGWNGTANLASAELYDPATGAWSATGPLTTARRLHHAVLLPSGKVLVAGGFGGDASAEVYDPATGAWTATGPMIASRWLATATLLPSGKVLVVGGHGGYASAELYDPATGAWTATGSLLEQRYGHAATLLPSGRVLVAGGWSPTLGQIASAEIYDPAAGTWSATGALTTPRGNLTATLLPSGKVLVLGAFWESGTAELYDPAAGTWSLTGPLLTPRSDATVTLLPSGKVLVAGGSRGNAPITSVESYDPVSGAWSAAGSFATGHADGTATVLPSGSVIVVGGFAAGGVPVAAAEMSDPAAGSWTATGPLATARQSFTATLLPSGKVLVVGGWVGNGASAASELYDPASGTWTAGGSLTTTRAWHTATLLPSGKVLVSGGWSSQGVSAVGSAELYDPASGTWTATGSLATARSRHVATLLPSGMVLVTGGDGALASAEIFDPARGTWSTTGSLSTGRTDFTATLLPSGRVLVAGGRTVSGTISTSAECYDPATGAWSPTGSLGAGRVYHTATLLPSGKVLVAGGSNLTGYPAVAEVFDEALGTWTAAAALITPRTSHSATLFPSGRVMIGGGEAGGTVHASAEIYDPATATWSGATSLAHARAGHSATLLPTGRVLSVGGWGAGILSSAELFDEGLGSQPAWSPTIAVATGSAVTGSTLALQGTRFTGVSEGSAGHTRSSPTNHPLLQLQAADGALTFANVTGFGATWLAADLPPTLPPGPYWARVVVSGSPSDARYLDVRGPACRATGPCAVVGWGSNDNGQIAPPPGLGAVRTVASNNAHVLAVKNDGTVAAWGWNGHGQANVPAGLTNVVSVAAGWAHSVALRRDGTMVGWGWNAFGIATAPAGLSGVVAIAAGDVHTVALKSDGTVAVWGASDLGQTAVPPGLSGVVAIAAGGWHTLAVKGDGTVVAWGHNSGGQSTVPAGLTGVVAVAAGYDHSLALRNDGTVVAWGGNGSGQTSVPAGLTGVKALAASWSNSVALRSDGTVVAWGQNANGQASVPVGLIGATAIASGARHALAVTSIPPLMVSPATATVDPGFQRTFGASGGTAPYSWAVSANNSGGSITTNGVYTAGTTGNVADTVTVTDSVGASASATITVPAPLTITNGSGGNLTAAASGQVTLSASGGSGPYTWTLTTNGSGGSVTTGGVYTAGPNGGTDTITVTDANGGSTTITITVVPASGGGEAHGAPALGTPQVALAAMALLLLGLAMTTSRTRRR